MSEIGQNTLANPRIHQALADEIAPGLNATQIRVRAVSQLSGGAVQENWSVELEIMDGPHAGNHTWVLRTDAQSAVAISLGRKQEYEVLCRVVDAGVLAPPPYLFVEQSAALARPYFLMQRLAGVTEGHRLTRDPLLIAEPAGLLGDLAQSLANLHRISPSASGLDFLLPAQATPPVAIESYRAFLDQLEEPQPVLEWGLNWCERHLPCAGPVSLVHRDFRTGNFLVNEGRLSGILDWEFAGFGDPREDLGWFTARCWRFAGPERHAGGIGSAQQFLNAYHAAGGALLQPEDLRYWQVLAHLRWGVIALQQAQRHLSGRERSLELALTGRILPELEAEVLFLTRE